MKEASAVSSSVPKKVAIAIAANAALLVVVELALRAFGPSFNQAPIQLVPIGSAHASASSGEEVFREHPELHWELRPEAIEIPGGDAINEHALRGPAYPLKKSPGTFRVAVLGDSCTFGVRLHYDQTYGARLEQFLSVHRQAEVINGGVSGYSIYQGDLAFRTNTIRFDPDVVVLYFGHWNDGKAGNGGTDRQRAALTSGGSVRRGFERLAFYRMLRDSMRGPVLAYEPSAVHDAWLAGDPMYGYRVNPDEFETVLDGLLTFCAERGIRAIAVMPETHQDLIRESKSAVWNEQNRLLELYRARIQDVAGSHDVPTVDMRKVFQGRSDADVFVPNDPVHPDANGTLLLAAAIYDTIQERGWADLGSSRSKSSPTRALTAESFDVREGDRVRLQLDGGRERAGEPYFIVPSARANLIRSSADLTLTLGPISQDLLANPGLAATFGLFGVLDADGRASAQVQLPEGQVPGTMLGFFFATGEPADVIPKLATDPLNEWRSNDVWVRLQPPQ